MYGHILACNIPQSKLILVAGHAWFRINSLAEMHYHGVTFGYADLLACCGGVSLSCLFCMQEWMPTTRSHHAWQPQINARFKAVYSGIHLFLLAGEFDTQSHASIALNMLFEIKDICMYGKLCEIWIVEGELHSLESVHACVWRILLVW